MATHRAIAQDIRETRIDNFGDPDKSIQNGGHKYKKLTTDSSVESQSTDINSNSNSNQDCIVVLGQESCYDTDGQSICTSIGGGMERDANEITKDNGGDIQQDGAGNNTTTSNNDKEVISKCGHLEVALLYDAPMRKMTVHVLQARDIPSRDRGQPTHTQVRLLLLPSKKQKHKTKIRSGDNPQYMESFLLHRINPEDVNSMGLRLRVYGCERMRREQLIGECVVSFSSLDLELETTLWLALEPRATSSHHGSISPTHHVDLRSLARSDSTGSAQSMQHGGVPELLLGLAYNATTGRLSVEIVKGSHFRNLAMNRAPDTYVKLCLVSSNGQEMARSKTSVRRGQPNPLFKETFVFQVALFQLADVTLMISVYNRKGMTKRKEMIGWFSLGLNSSGPEQLAHWLDMKDLHAQQLCRWHVLVDS
ncbi:synaptotagmin-16 [Chrysoperla carnea]|uniref:synaptotagmin-16 n=1 Tax=Chrysoperla carnea TaxID=189513 RepID=UPI001D065CF6|nr:synaptotagmin-16 [Chrysoperla carnea]